MNNKKLLARAKELGELDAITRRIETRDLPFIRSLSDEMAKHQPFMMSVIKGYTVDLKKEEADALLKIHLLIWWKYRQTKSCRNTPVTETLHTKAMMRNTGFFKYLEKEEGTPMFSQTISDDFKHNDHLVLLGYITRLFQKWPALKNMEEQDKGIVTLSIKSFAECFEEMIKNGISK